MFSTMYRFKIGEGKITRGGGGGGGGQQSREIDFGHNLCPILF